MVLISLPFIDNLAEKKLKDLIVQSLKKDAKISCQIESLNIHWLSTSVELDKVSINANHARAMSTTINSIHLNGLSIVKWFKEHKLHFDNVRLDNLVIDYVTDKQKDTTKVKTDNKLHCLAETFEIHNAKINLFLEKDSSAFGAFTLEKLQIDSFIYANATKGKIDELLVTGIKTRTGNKLYEISTDTLNYKDEKRCVEFINTDIIPTCDAEEFFRRSKTQTDRIVFKSDFCLYLKKAVELSDSSINCRLVEFEQFSIQALRNKKYPPSTKDKKSVQRILHELPLNFNTDTLTIRNGSIKYIEIPESENRAGIINFTHLDADLFGFNTEAGNSGLNVFAAADFQDANRLHINLFIPLNTDNVSFNCSGYMGPMPLEVTDSVVRNLTPVTIKSGQMDTLHFSFYADETAARGSMLFRFHDLKIELQNKENQTTTTSKFLSELLHLLKLKEDNVTPGHINEDVTAIYYKRNPDKFIFNYCWKAILSGMMPAVGADKLSVKM